MTRHWLIALRAANGYTHQQVADEASVDRSYSAKIERGTNCPSPCVAKSLGVTLDVDWNLFLNKMHQNGACRCKEGVEKFYWKKYKRCNCTTIPSTEH